jgi:hypothetical protein
MVAMVDTNGSPELCGSSVFYHHSARDRYQTNEGLSANSPRVSKPNENKPEVTVDVAKQLVLPYMESVTMNIEQKKEKERVESSREFGYH